MSQLPVTVMGEVYAGKNDPSSEAAFANLDRAQAYANLILAEYPQVAIYEAGSLLGHLVRGEDA